MPAVTDACRYFMSAVFAVAKAAQILISTLLLNSQRKAFGIKAS